MRNKVLWSDETKMERLGLNAKCHIWRKPGTMPTVNHVVAVSCCGDFLSVAARLVRIKGKMNGAKYRDP